MKKLPFYIYWGLFILSLIQTSYYYPQLPETIATHFGGGGRADGWMSRESSLLLTGAVLLMNVGIFVVMPWVTRKFKLVKQNPKKPLDFFTPERIDEFYDFFKTRMCWFGVANLLFGMGVTLLVFKANTAGGQVLDNSTFLLGLVAYFVFVIIWLISFFLKFRKTN